MKKFRKFNFLELCNFSQKMAYKGELLGLLPVFTHFSSKLGFFGVKIVILEKKWNNIRQKS